MKRKNKKKFQIEFKDTKPNRKNKSSLNSNSYETKSRHRFLAKYKYQSFDWEDLEICRRMIKIAGEYRFPLPIAKPEWNKHKAQFESYSQSLNCFLNENNAGGLMAILNLDIIIGVSLGILASKNNPRIKITEVTKMNLEKRLFIEKLDHYKELRYLLSRQNELATILEIDEQVITSSEHKKRKTFVFTIQSNRTGYFVVESLDHNTATHIFSYDTNDTFSYFVAKARIREYFQSMEYNKRLKLYNDKEMNIRSIERIGSVNHTVYKGWKVRLKNMI